MKAAPPLSALLFFSLLSPITPASAPASLPAQEPGGGQDRGDPASQAARMTVAAADANRDNKISKKEWTKFLKGLKPKKDLVETAHVLGLVLQRHLDRDTDRKLEREDLEQIFATFDANDDGILDPGEMTGRGNQDERGRGRRGNRMDPNARRIARSVIATADRDGDGEVPFGDWSLFLDGVMPGKRAKKKGHVDLDKLAAVFLPREEGESAPEPERPPAGGGAVESIVAALKPDDQGRTAVEVLEKMFAGLDENEDGTLERVELTGSEGWGGGAGGAGRPDGGDDD